VHNNNNLDVQAIVEVLLRNPKHSQLLYRPNKNGETPYNLDMKHNKTILGQIFGQREFLCMFLVKNM
jgi:ankyrin repeat-rich membrane spanning protein